MRWTTGLICIAALIGSGTAQANLLTNGDFEAGNTGFSTDYAPDVLLSLAATFTVASSIPNGWAPGFVDHTTGAGLMAVSVSTEQGFTLGQPQLLFEDPSLFAGGPGAKYDVSADGQRFVTVAPVEGEGETVTPSVRIVQNWYEEFRDRERD